MSPLRIGTRGRRPAFAAGNLQFPRVGAETNFCERKPFALLIFWKFVSLCPRHTPPCPPATVSGLLCQL